MGFKDFLDKMKDGATSFAKNTARVNASGFCGTVDHGITNSDFVQDAFLNIEDGKGLIYGKNLEDYIFTAEDIVSFEQLDNEATLTQQSTDNRSVINCMITFRDGKKAHTTMQSFKLDYFKQTFKLQ